MGYNVADGPGEQFGKGKHFYFIIYFFLVVDPIIMSLVDDIPGPGTYE